MILGSYLWLTIVQTWKAFTLVAFVVLQIQGLRHFCIHVQACTSLSFRWCNLLTNHAIRGLVCNTVLNLRCCKNLGDEALPAVSSLRELKMLQLDNSDITDAGMAYLRHGIISSLISLSIRGYKKLTDKCISVLFDGSSKLTYRIFLIYPIMAFLLLQEAKFQFPNSDCDNVHSKVILQSWPHLPLWFNSDSNS
ncbi:hypothetical protein V6N13_118355 [Hibiscus sabdariffa]